MMVEDLGRQVAQKSIESAEWKARALSAEAALASIKAEAEAEEEGGLKVVKDEE